MFHKIMSANVGITLWNKLAESLTNAKTYNFKQNFKKYY